MKCGPDDCPIRAFSDLTPAEQRVERKRTAEKMTAQGFTQAQIAKQLGVSDRTISEDLRGFEVTSKPLRPKGGRPKNPPKRPPTPREKELAERDAKVFALAAAGVSSKEIAAATRTHVRHVDLLKKRDQAYEQGRADAAVSYEALPKSSQEKVDIVIKRLKRELEKSFHTAVQKEVSEWGAVILPKLHAELKQARQREQAVCSRKFISKEDFNAIRRCLHPDSRNSLSDAMLAKAFNKFQDLEKYLLDAVDAPTPFTKLPETMAEWDKMRAKATAARKAKRANGKQAVSRHAN